MAEQNLYDRLKAEAQHVGFWQQHRFLIMVGGAIVLSLFMVGIALSSYHNSGTAQLDLSRPGYQEVREQVDREGDNRRFSANGPLDEAALTEFRELYDEQAKSAQAEGSFAPEALSDEALELDRVFTATP